MAGKKGMKSIRYSEEMKQGIRRMIAEGYTQQQIAEHFGLKDRFVVHQILKRDRKKQREKQIPSVRKGRPRQYPLEDMKALQTENERLRMENELMRSFLELLRKE